MADFQHLSFLVNITTYIWSVASTTDLQVIFLAHNGSHHGAVKSSKDRHVDGGSSIECRGGVRKILRSEIREAVGEKERTKTWARWWQLNFFLFSPQKLGKISNSTHIFQMD